MVDFAKIPVPFRAMFLSLFTAQNYCFATNVAGRSPTFYFAQGGLQALNTSRLCGRIRTQHPSGALIDVTDGAKGHFFSRKESRRDRIFDKLGAGQDDQGLLAMTQRYRTAPRQGDYHVEFTRRPGTNPPYHRRHRSGGTIVLAPRITSDNMATALIERVMSGPCMIELNRAHVGGTQGGVAIGNGLNVAAYLAGL